MAKKAAYRVRDIREEEPSEERGAEGDDPSLQRPFPNPAPFHVPAANDDIIPFPDLLIHPGDQHRRMGKICIYDD